MKRLTLLVAVLATLAAPTTYAARSGQVTVTNTASQPVPVTVTNPTNTSANVTVTNPTSKPVPVEVLSVTPATAGRVEISGSASNQQPGPGFGQCLDSPMLASTIVASSLNGAGFLDVAVNCEGGALTFRVVVPANTTVVVPLPDRVFVKGLQWSCIQACAGHYTVNGQTAP